MGKVRFCAPIARFADHAGMNEQTVRVNRADPRPAAPVGVRVPGPVRTDRLTLRRLDEHDRAVFLGLVKDNTAHLEGLFPLHEPGESDDAYFDRMLAAAAEGDARGTAWRRVGVLGDGSIVGCFHLNAITRGLAWEADASWWIARDHTGRGLATEGVRAMLDHAFEPLPAGLGLHAVHCGISPGNTASRRVAEKCGFRHVPERQSYLKVGPDWVMHDFFIAEPDG